MRKGKPASRHSSKGCTVGLGRRPQRAVRHSLARSNADEIRKFAAELATLAPDVILATGSATGPLLQVTRAVPIVFVVVVDPVGAGYIASLARPGGNATGFTAFEYGLSAKWLELLKQIAAGVTRVAVLRDPAITVVSAGLARSSPQRRRSGSR